MSKWKNLIFNRWTPIYEHSLPYRVFKAYNEEIFSYITNFERNNGYIYSHLKKDGARWGSRAFDFGLTESDKTQTVKEWSNKNNEYRNWARLSFLMSCCSFFENYLASIIKEVIESDSGILIGFPHSVDGIQLIKHNGRLSKESIETVIINCTKGEWQSRLTYLNRLSNNIPQILNDSISELEMMRKLRNVFGHAFGRDIQSSQYYFSPTIPAINRLSIRRFNAFHHLIRAIVRELDKAFMSNHIGNFEPLLQFHTIYPSIQNLDKGEQMVRFKAALYRERSIMHGANKKFCRALIDYYNKL